MNPNPGKSTVSILSAAAFLTAASAFATLPADVATTYYWQKSDNEWGTWDYASNWRIGAEDGDAASGPPGQDDYIYGEKNGFRRNYDLDDGDWTIAGWETTGDWNRHYVAFRNGTIRLTGDKCVTHSDPVTLESGSNLVWEKGSLYYASRGHGAEDQWYVRSGASLAMYGTFLMWNVRINVDEGADMVLAPEKIGFSGASWYPGTIANNGTLKIPHGLSFEYVIDHEKDMDGPVDKGMFTLKQQGGVLEIGGPVSKNSCEGTYTVNISGGAIHATGDVSLDVSNTIFSGDATIDVDDGATLDAGDSSYDGAIALVKTGAGALVLHDVPDSLTVQSGAVSFRGATATQMSRLALAAGTVFETPLPNLRIDSIPAFAGTLAITKPGLYVRTAASAAARVTVDLSGFTPGSVVATTPDSALRAKIKTAAEAAAAENGMSIALDGQSVVVAITAGTPVFESTTVRDMANAAGWSTGSVPPAGADVLVKGGGVMAEYTPETPQFGSISVLDGAKLVLRRLSGATSIDFGQNSGLVVGTGIEIEFASAPAVGSLALEPGSRIVVADGCSFTMPATFAATATGIADLPEIDVGDGAVLSVPGGFKFRNVKLDLRGSVEASSDGPLTFGYAAAGETAWFGMYASNATIRARNNVSKRGGSNLRFFCPEDGGRVVPAAKTEFHGTTFARTGNDGFDFGVLNPEEIDVEIELADSSFDSDFDLAISGGVRLVARDGTAIRKRTYSIQNDSSNVTVSGRGVLDLEDGSFFMFQISGNGNGQNGCLKLKPSQDGYESLVIGDGARASYFTLSKAAADLDGNRGTIVLGNGAFEVATPTWYGLWRHCRAFEGSREVRIEDGKTFLYRRASISQEGDSQSGDNHAYVFDLADFTGTGDLRFCNVYSGKTLDVTISNAMTRAGGTVSAEADHDNCATRLRFFDGSAWGGTVEWNDESTFLAGPEVETADPERKIPGPAEVAFGGLHLATDISICVWEDGRSDLVNVGAGGITGGGKIKLALQDDFELDDGPSWLVARVPAGTALPAVEQKLYKLIPEPAPGKSGCWDVWARQAITMILLK